MFDSSKLLQACTLYAVTDRAWLNGRTLTSCVEEAIKGGATFVQLRDKDASTASLVLQSKALLPLCRRAGIPYVIDDDVEAALASGADGVHVGQSDTACAEARAKLGPDAIVGVSVQTLDQAYEAERAGADYLGVGAVALTDTKPEADVVTLETLKEICEAVSIPVVAIGGVNSDTLDQLAGSGIAGVAVVSAIFAQPHIEEATHALRSQVDAMLIQ